MEKFNIKMKSALTLVVTLTALLFTSCNGNAQQAQGGEGAIQNVNTDQFKRAENNPDVILLDVRTPNETKQGIIDGAITMDIYNANFDQKLATLDTAKQVYVYCKSGARSSKAATKLEAMGFKKVYNLKGGIMGWQGSGENTVKP